ncbi:LacI family DNA-binding transcriptional regulator [Microbacterium sp. SORGH_AS_0888]|uniref:LacI family DNA-binding transcriptional regulator n=1 Tax=Microbacterium sp. SORGH_AS_0888 TaxID=3041791 RepID=UPI00277DB192|nr:LacI family DNA-binding transcriptional regulator [Microbacterium sp. SORGH_AS_0888]MDQ1130848.1 DNA-binding LacI/PurR family transcriptional regulator [Microbacterium sp. SORGH_AS_0888]
MQQIARIAGVSVTTVSHVLSGNRPVSPRTADRVMAVIRQYDYVPVSAARRLKVGHSSLVGLVVPDLTVSYFAQLAKGVELAVESAGLGLIICSMSLRTPRRHLDLLRDGTMDGLVHLPFAARVDEEIAALAGDYPVVIADEELAGDTGLPTVVADNLQGGRLVGRHLAERGHRRALIVAGPETMLSSAQRVVGIKEHLPQALVLRGDFTAEAGYRLVDEALESGFGFTCVAAGNDEQALGAMRRLRAAGLSVPGDVSVTGFDDVAVADAIGLTTVRQPAHDLGIRAGELLLQQIARFDAGERRAAVSPELLPVAFVERRTTAAARARAAP